MVRWLTRAEVEAVQIAPDRALRLAATALCALANGDAEVPPKFGVHPPGAVHVHAMPAYIRSLDLFGLKWLGEFPANRARGWPTINSLIVLNDAQTGIPLAIMDGNWITALRTAAVTAVALRACSRPGVEIVAMIGTGLEARTHLLMLPAAFPDLTTVRIAGRTRESAERFIAGLGARSKPRLIASDSREAAVRGAPVVVTVTNATTTRLLEPEWLDPGVTVAVIDNAGKETGLLPSIDRMVVDDPAPFATEAVRAGYPAGVPRIDAQIGGVLLGAELGRTSPNERVLINSLGNAALDVVFGAEILNEAKAAGIGTELPL